MFDHLKPDDREKEGFMPDKIEACGALSFDKTVGGLLITEWLLKDFTFDETLEILGGISFDLYAADEYPDGKAFATAYIAGNSVDFGDQIPAGGYVIVEKLSGLAASVIKPQAPAPITISGGGANSLAS